ncbi:MAG: hypothetical protein J4F36_07135 [Nitrosopumilaceae archaeon]|nr:hypothetical protein [Nitrosopumilaceae archaeon]
MDSAYIFGFLDKNGVSYDYHISDDLKDNRTWESIDFKFSLPDSKYILIWRRDREKITPSEAKKIFEYIKDDMEEFMFETTNEYAGEGSQTKISSMLLPTKDCLIISYDEFILPPGNINWKNFTDLVSFQIDDMIEDTIKGKNNSEKIEDILDGTFFK